MTEHDDARIRERQGLGMGQADDLARRLMEISPVGMTVVNRQGQVIMANARAEQILGLTLDEITRRTYNAPQWRITTYDGEPFPDEELPFQRVMRTGEPVYGVAHAIEDAAGRRRFLAINAAPLRDEAGELEGMVAVIEDVTAQVQNERRLRDLVDAAPFGAHLYELQPDGRLIFVGANRSADTILGVDHAGFIGKTIEEAFPGLADTTLPAIYRLVAAEGRYYEDQRVDYNAEGIHGAFEVHAFPTGPNRMAAFFRDITAQRRAEEAVRQQAQTLAALHETALDLAAQRTLPDLVRAIVARAAGLTGARSGGIFLYRPDRDDLELVGTYKDPDLPVGAVLTPGEGLCGRVFASGQAQIVENYKDWVGRLTRYSFGEDFATLAIPIRWGEDVLGVLYLDRDVAPPTFAGRDIALLERFAPLAAAALQNHRLLRDLQEQMDRLRETQAQLIQAAKMAAIGSLAAGVAHEINNPMTSILGFSEIVLAEAPADFGLRDELHIIASESRRVSRIVRALLDFSRQTRAQRTPADVNEIIRQTLILIAEHMTKGGVDVEETYAADLPSLELDAGQMKQVFLNLLTNAAQAMPSGGRLSVRTERRGGEVAVRIADTGPGMPPEVLEHLFEPFYTTKPSGTGLGLAVSLGIVQEHKGRITVESVVGQGSTFTVWLPVNPAVQGDVPPAIPAAAC